MNIDYFSYTDVMILCLRQGWTFSNYPGDNEFIVYFDFCRTEKQVFNTNEMNWQTIYEMLVSKCHT